MQEHAKIFYDENSNEYFVKDLGSQNGTFINGSRLSEVCYDMVREESSSALGSSYTGHFFLVITCYAIRIATVDVMLL